MSDPDKYISHVYKTPTMELKSRTLPATKDVYAIIKILDDYLELMKLKNGSEK